MSTTKPKANAERLATYRKQNGSERVTPRQARRLTHKAAGTDQRQQRRTRRAGQLEPSGECVVRFGSDGSRVEQPHRWRFDKRFLRKATRECAVCGEREVVG